MALTTDDVVAGAPRVVDTPIISADSHITEPGWTYVDNIDPAYRDRAPYLIDEQPDGAAFHVPGMRQVIHLGLHSAAGRASDALQMRGTPFADLHRAGWDAEARVEAQRADGLDGEVIYPSVGMLLCNHPDLDLKKAMFDAYNRWIAEYCAVDPTRLYGCGQTAMRTPEEGVADLEAIKAAGLRGVMLPGTPGPAYEDGPDYDDPAWDDVYRAAIDLELVLSFHILTGKSYQPRGPKLNNFMSIIRGNQDLIGTFIFGGVFDRVPDLKIVCVEADAGWVPHYAYRMDHAYNRHRNWLKGGLADLERKPSDYFADHVYVTFQDDWSAFRMAEAGLINPDRLLWANDFPHSDSTWPYSQHMLAEQTADLPEVSRQRILGGNTVELYNLHDVVATA